MRWYILQAFEDKESLSGCKICSGICRKNIEAERESGCDTLLRSLLQRLKTATICHRRPPPATHALLQKWNRYLQRKNLYVPFYVPSIGNWANNVCHALSACAACPGLPCGAQRVSCPSWTLTRKNCYCYCERAILRFLTGERVNET